MYFINYILNKKPIFSRWGLDIIGESGLLKRKINDEIKNNYCKKIGYPY
jgi:hypothetical protein